MKRALNYMSESGNQLPIHVPVCVHACKALINHRYDTGGWGEGVPGGVEYVLQSSLRETERRRSRFKRGGVKDEGMAEHKKHWAEKALRDGG